MNDLALSGSDSDPKVAFLKKAIKHLNNANDYIEYAVTTAKLT